MEDEPKVNKPARYQPYITLGNILTVLGLATAGVTFFLSYHDRLMRVEAAQITSDHRDVEFKREVLQKLSDLQTDVREIRSSSGVTWRETPRRRDR